MAMSRSRPVAVTYELDVFDRQSDEGIRVDFRVHVDAKVDVERRLPVVMRWTAPGLAKEHVRLTAGSWMLGPLQPWAPEDVRVRTRSPARDRRRAEEIGLYDLTGELRALEPHAITGRMHPPRERIVVEVLPDGSVQGIDRERFDLGDFDAEVGRIRATVAEKLLFREPEGWFVPQRLPSWVVKPNRPERPEWRVELERPSNHYERAFGLARLDAARDFCRWMNKGVDGPVSGEIIDIDRTWVVDPDDIVTLAKAAPIVARSPLLKVMELEGPLIRDWHAALNAKAILLEEGRSGAERILAGCSRLADHLVAKRGRIDDLHDWSSLIRRIEQEGIVSTPSLGSKP